MGFVAKINIIYGIADETQKGSRDIWDVRDSGNVDYDPIFDVSSIEAQLHLDMLCQRMREGWEDMTVAGGANCWIGDFKEWIQNEDLQWTGDAVGNQTWSFPLDLQDYFDAIGSNEIASETDQKTLFTNKLCLFVHGEPGYVTYLLL